MGASGIVFVLERFKENEDYDPNPTAPEFPT